MTPLENNTTKIQEILNAVNNLPSAGTQLPTLTTPAGPENIEAGYEAIDGNGEKMVGTLEPQQLQTVEVQQIGDYLLEMAYSTVENGRIVSRSGKSTVYEVLVGSVFTSNTASSFLLSGGLSRVTYDGSVEILVNGPGVITHKTNSGGVD